MSVPLWTVQCVLNVQTNNGKYQINHLMFVACGVVVKYCKKKKCELWDTVKVALNGGIHTFVIKFQYLESCLIHKMNV